MSSTGRPAKTASVIDITGDGSVPESLTSEGRLQRAIEHLLAAFGMFTAIRDDAGRIVDFQLDNANHAARVIPGATPQGEAGESLVGTVAEHQKRELFDDFCHVMETGEPLATQSLEHEVAKHGGKRLVRAYEVRAARMGDGLAVGWRDVTRHVLAEAELERLNRS